MSRFALSVVWAATVALLPSAAAAQPIDKTTVFTFSGAPVALPGVTLPEGEYVFRLANPMSGVNVVQVLNADGTKPHGLFFSIPAQRPEPSDKPEVRFHETAAGAPPAIRTWWYPGQTTGYEFIYPKDQARRLAEGSGQAVLTTRAASTTVEEDDTSDLVRVSPDGREEAVRAEAQPAEAPTSTASTSRTAPPDVTPATGITPSAPEASASNAPANTAADQPPASTAGSATNARGAAARAVGTSGAVAQDQRSALPQTAGSRPFTLAIGLTALGLAAFVGVWRRGWVI
jgi:hypothetical protein